MRESVTLIQLKKVFSFNKRICVWPYNFLYVLNCICIFILLFFSCGCKSNLDQNDVSYNVYKNVDMRKAERNLYDYSEMTAKRMCEVQIEWKRNHESKEILALKIKEVEESAKQAYAKCEKSNHELPFKPDWGGHEEFLRNALMSDLLPDTTDKEREIKTKMRSIDLESKEIHNKYFKRDISESEKNAKMELILEKLKDINK